MAVKSLFGMLVLLAIASPAAAELAEIKLSPPDLNAPGKTVLQALNARKSDRVFSEADLNPAQLSAILWAAGGINRPATADGSVGRTAPSGHNLQAIDVFAVAKAGVYKYDYRKHALLPVAEGDYRASAGLQDYVAAAPLNLIYVADMSKLHGDDDTAKRLDANMDVGFIAENVYLYCAATGLNVISRSSIDAEALRPILKLDDSSLPLLGQTVGRPPAKK